MNKSLVKTVLSLTLLSLLGFVTLRGVIADPLLSVPIATIIAGILARTVK